MAKAAATTLWKELRSSALYKPSQGRIVRQATAYTMFAVVVLGAYIWQNSWMIGVSIPWSTFFLPSDADATPWIKYGIPWAWGALGCWIAYRLVNHQPFAEFLIAVEGELVKVSWPSKSQLKLSTIVVIGVMFFFGALLFAYDILWSFVLTATGILRV